MLYFILWAVFIVGIILAVPIAAVLSKPKGVAAMPIDEGTGEFAASDATEVPPDPAVADPGADFGGGDFGGGGDLGAADFGGADFGDAEFQELQ